MSLLYERTDDYVLTLSDAAYAALHTEQRDLNHDQQRAEILTWTVCAGVVAIAVLMIKHLLGA